MLKQKRLRDYGVNIGQMKIGKQNAITDVAGVTVGHITLSKDEVQTGVTAILPHQGNLFREKLIAASFVINGFGKTMGTIQINELGTLETPILLTNTLSIGTAADALIDYMLERTPEIGHTTGTVNPVVAECNDMVLNAIRKKVITKKHVLAALEQAATEFTEGSFGAGTGMLCYSLKGGIGTASRLIELDYGTYTLGVLVLANFGQLGDLKINGQPVGHVLQHHIKSTDQEKDKGSIIMTVATDLPVTQSQLQRIIKRTVTGLARTGATLTNGSGEIAIGFSTATKIPHEATAHVLHSPSIPEGDIDIAFRAVGEATEEAILNALITAHSIIGRDGNERPALKDLIETHPLSLGPRASLSP
ncbi:aminopeptidase [Pullulanibacillus camelliae]|uniref:Aminopeptidase n=1 Tax=Pullulanibacillus camelliae TaxID=1707096 RepID=A0A8J2YFP2_9BACL|nr:P1 family peptidase [Pullulanibacillus camelliae]GGE30691.1 aminopeptidase [Pullulanibacillus camelliae]